MDTYNLEVGCMAPFPPYWLSWSNGYDICLPNFKMLAEDPSSILGGRRSIKENPGPHFFFAGFLRFELSSFDDADDRRDEQDLLF